MKFSKSLLAVIAMAGTMGFSAVASAMDFSVYGSLRAGYNQKDESAAATANISGVATTPAVTAVAAVAGVDANNDGDFDDAGDTKPVAAVAAVAAATAPSESFDDVKLTGYGLPGMVTEGVKGLVGNGELLSAHTVTEAGDDPETDLVLGHGEFGSRIGVRGSEDLGNGAEAGLHWEVNVDGAGSTGTGRHANVWYSGAFGKITIGQQGNPYRNAANWDQSFWIGGNNRYGDGGSRLQGIRYDGDAGAFNFSVMGTAGSSSAVDAYSAQVNTKSNRDAAGAALATPEANDTYGTVSIEAQDKETGIDSWIATGHYDMGVATINLGYRTNNEPAGDLGVNYDNFVISANGALDALTWYVAFESNTDNVDLTVEEDANTGATQEYNSNLWDALTTEHDVSTIGLFLGYALSDVSTLYFEYEDSANDGLDYAGDNLDKNAILLGFSRQFGPNTQFIAEYNTIDNNSELVGDSSLLQAYLRVDF